MSSGRKQAPGRASAAGGALCSWLRVRSPWQTMADGDMYRMSWFCRPNANGGRIFSIYGVDAISPHFNDV